jgi:hypothetical protein
MPSRTGTYKLLTMAARIFIILNIYRPVSIIYILLIVKLITEW